MRRFALIGEAEARTIEPGSTVELERGGHVTPLAQDTLRARRVTVVRAGSFDPALPADLAPPAVITRVAIGADHTGLALRQALVAHLRQAGLAVEVFGAEDQTPVDYPDVAGAVARAVVRGQADAGIVIDGAGLGSTIAANKVRGARAAMCQSPTLARYAREHNGANVLALGASLVTAAEAREIVDTWRSTPMREPRYLRRLLKVRDLEERF
ncbi:MAG: RpiB/LacA/LacB family sugar-phosphate isomerase [Vicinamibacterales bacterium]